MNYGNLDFLKETLKLLGFGKACTCLEKMDTMLTKRTIEFNLQTEVAYDGMHSLEVTLHFRRSENTGIFSFYKYDAILNRGKGDTKERSHTFYVKKEGGIALKEAYNLLRGRAVNKNLVDKNGRKYNAWIELEFGEKDRNDNYRMRQFRGEHGYDLERVLEKYHIQELKDETLRDGVIKSLKMGNEHAVTFMLSNSIQRMYIAANPRQKALHISAVRRLELDM